MKIIDFHSHILPHIDDGAKDTAMTIRLLEESQRQGVDAIVATPHFLDNEEDIEKFISVRQNMYEMLKKRIAEQGIKTPEIFLGAEVSLSRGLADYENLEKLCIEKTKYILIEMPYSYWEDWVYDEIFKLIAKRGLKPIVAHIERYLYDEEAFFQCERLSFMNVLIQFNADSFLKFKKLLKIKKIVKRTKERKFLLGSDCHNDGQRSTKIDKACKKIIKVFGQDFLEEIFKTADDILKSE